MKDLEQTFHERVERIDSLYVSYSSLFDIYSSIMKTAQVNQNARTAFDRAKASADTQQKAISEQLYSQGFILLTGMSEALLKDVFSDLLYNNFAVLKAKNIKFDAAEIQNAIIETNDDNLESLSLKLGKRTAEKIFNSQNPSEKVNFQNVNSMKEIFSRYFGVKLPIVDELDRIHKYWMMRHCIIHNDGQIDQRYINNVNKVGLLKRSEIVGSKIAVSKTEYTNTKNDFGVLFHLMDLLISEAGLSSTYSSNQIEYKSSI